VNPVVKRGGFEPAGDVAADVGLGPLHYMGVERALDPDIAAPSSGSVCAASQYIIVSYILRR
jgi:hypothetical protein